jgi:hypothetical protein
MRLNEYWEVSDCYAVKGGVANRTKSHASLVSTSTSNILPLLFLILFCKEFNERGVFLH